MTTEQPVVEATEPTLHDTINDQFKVLQTGLNDMFKMSRTMQDQLKALQKSCRQVEKKTRVKKKRPQESMTLSAELSKFLSQKKDVQMTKADVMKQISGYIKKEKASRKVLQEVEAEEVKRRRQGRTSNAPTLSGTPSGTKEEAEAADEEREDEEEE